MAATQRTAFCRFIPAYAGNAHGPAIEGCQRSVHPRIRGERLAAWRPQSAPPRFIPAYAGNAPRPAERRTQVAVHPRIRGERILASAADKPLNGSSPHTRGTPNADRMDAAARRFIPAYAGNAYRPALCRPRRPVHPRIRGERGCAGTPHTLHLGSSPHTRGTRPRTGRVYGQIRFIPAYAGNAPPRVSAHAWPPVHPRIRGERSRATDHISRRIGSSPHTRGTRGFTHTPSSQPRFIPAYAGNANGASDPVTDPSVHPRIRGERTSNKLLIYRRKSESSDSTKHSGC